MTEPDQSIADILRAGRAIWGDQPMSLQSITNCATVVVGDLAREARAATEIGQPDWTAVRRELGNLIASSVRWADDLGFDPETCVAEALGAQIRYAQRIGVKR